MRRRIWAIEVANQTKKRLKASLQVPLAWTLIIPFTLQIVTVVGLVGFLSYRNGQRSVEDLTNQLMNSVSKQIERELNSYLAAPRIVNQLNSDAILRGDLSFDLDRPDRKRDQYLWQKMQLFQNLTWISLGSETGDYVGAWRPEIQQNLQIAIANSSTQNYLNYYATDYQGRRIDRVKVEQRVYDPRKRPWYQQAIRAHQNKAAVHGSAWTGIYPGFTSGTLFLAASQPLYDRTGKLIGVSSTDLSLLNIQTFLEQNPVSASGETFLMERSGLLVASSSQELPFRLVAGEAKRVNALNSQTPLIQATAQFLHQKVNGFASIDQPQNFHFWLGREREFVQVLPFSQEPGLDWLIVIVIPESDVIGQVSAGTRSTVLLCIAALIGVIVLNTVISRWFVKLIRELSQASQQIAQGDFSHQVQAPRIRELSTLANSFTQMSQEIQQSHQRLEDYSRSLEQKVNDRTQILQQEIENRLAAEVALQSANEQLQRLAYLDGLTQIANRRQFDERLIAEWHRMKRDRSPLSIILCDVDFFKQYNDTYGHQVGDDCLRAVASAIATAARRPPDLSARYGGEEFAVLLPNTPLKGAIEVAQIIQIHIKGLQLPHRQSQVSQFVTASFGVASIIPTEETAPEQLLAEVDRALYQAKIEGRDRVRSNQDQ